MMRNVKDEIREVIRLADLWSERLQTKEPMIITDGSYTPVKERTDYEEQNDYL